MEVDAPWARFALCSLGLAVLFAKPINAQGVDVYKLQPSDRLSVQIVDWPSDVATSGAWNALSREYVVAPDGTVSVPLAGRLSALGASVAEFQEMLETAIKEEVGLKVAPGISVSVSEYAPVSLVGDVDVPGAYPLPPGTLAIEAIARAGGYRAAGSAFSLQRDLASSVAERAADQASIINLKAREARLVAQYAGADGMDLSGLPHALVENGGLPDAISREVEVFRLSKEQSEEALQGYSELIDLLNSEIASIEQKIESQRKRLAEVSDVAERIEDLGSRGLVSSDRIMAAQASQASLEGSLIDLEQARFEARVRISELERERRLGISESREEALSELIEVRSRLSQLENEVAGSVAIEALIGLELGQASMTNTKRSILVLRRVEGEVVEIPAHERTLLQPSDVVIVSIDETD